jgi:hypothetical protein
MISERAFAHSFDSFWRELFPLLNPSFVAIFNEAYEHRLADSMGAELELLPIHEEVNSPDLVAEVAFRLVRLAHQHKLSFSQVDQIFALIEEAEAEALNLILRYEGKSPTSAIGLSREEREEGLRLALRYQHLFPLFPSDSPTHFCPRFPGAGFLDSCEGDLGISSCLIEIKTTVRKPSGKDLRQLLTYLALSSNTGASHWKQLGIFNPRRGTIHLADIDSFVLRISGGRPPVDVFAELISFVESNDIIIDKRF